MKTLCRCGHAKSQHHSKRCDYEGYSCRCTGYERIPQPTDEERKASRKDAMDFSLNNLKTDIDRCLTMTGDLLSYDSLQSFQLEASRLARSVKGIIDFARELEKKR